MTVEECKAVAAERNAVLGHLTCAGLTTCVWYMQWRPPFVFYWVVQSSMMFLELPNMVPNKANKPLSLLNRLMTESVMFLLTADVFWKNQHTNL